MPKKVTPKKSTAKKKPAAKPRAKAKLKSAAPAKKVLKKSAAVQAKQEPVKNGFMWKLLERKEAELKRREQARADQRGGRAYDQSGHADVGHARFNGPRRKAA